MCDDPNPNCCEPSGCEGVEQDPCTTVYTVYAYSTDADQADTNPPSFSDPVRLNEDAPYPLVPECGQGIIGDYIGIDCAGNKVYPLYPGGRFVCVPNNSGPPFSILTNRIQIGVNDADFNGDGDVDQTDYTTFQNCSQASGPGVPAQPGCMLANLDGDCDVGCVDQGLFRCWWTDPGDPPAPCLDDCCGDFDGDNDVDLTDYVAFASCFGADPLDLSTSCPPENFLCADLNDDCEVDLADFVIFSCLLGQDPNVACAGCQSSAASSSPNLSALATWMVEHIPAVERECFAAQCRALAERTEDAETASALLAFAQAIAP